jgi:hypothetical protein
MPFWKRSSPSNVIYEHSSNRVEKRGRENAIHFDNANVCNASTSWHEVDKEPVNTVTCFSTTGNTAGL